MTKKLDPAIKLQRTEKRLCTCGADVGDGHPDWCPSSKFDRIPKNMTAADACKRLGIQ